MTQTTSSKDRPSWRACGFDPDEPEQGQEGHACRAELKLHPEAGAAEIEMIGEGRQIHRVHFRRKDLRGSNAQANNRDQLERLQRLSMLATLELISKLRPLPSRIEVETDQPAITLMGAQLIPSRNGSFLSPVTRVPRPHQDLLAKLLEGRNWMRQRGCHVIWKLQAGEEEEDSSDVSCDT